MSPSPKLLKEHIPPPPPVRIESAACECIPRTSVLIRVTKYKFTGCQRSLTVDFLLARGLHKNDKNGDGYPVYVQ